MYRVVTDMTKQQSGRVLDRGPWLDSQQEAKAWADLFGQHGYRAYVERLEGGVSGTNQHVST